MNSKRDFLIERRKQNQYNFDLINALIAGFYLIVMIVIAMFNKDTTF